MQAKRKQAPALAQPPMSKEEFLKLQAKSEFEILDAIRKGDLKKLETFKFRAEGIDSPLCTDHDTQVYPKISKQVVIEKVTSPTVLSYAILCEQPEVVQFFLSKFPCDLGVYVHGWTPMHFAAATKDTSCLKLLLQHEYAQRYINDGIESDHGVTTPLHIAAMFGNYETVFLLTSPFPAIKFPLASRKKIENTIDCNKLNANGLSALHIAVKNNDWEMFQVLVSVGASQSVVTKDGQSPFELAKALGFAKMAELLETSEIESAEVLKGRHVKLETKEMKFYEEVINIIDQTDAKMDQIIKKVSATQGCCFCHEELGTLCNQCQQTICKACWSNSSHNCIISRDQP